MNQMTQNNPKLQKTGHGKQSESFSWLQSREMPRHDTETSLAPFHAWVGKMPPNASKLEQLHS
jgi:hypothetical protein